MKFQPPSELPSYIPLKNEKILLNNVKEYSIKFKPEFSIFIKFTDVDSNFVIINLTNENNNLLKIGKYNGKFFCNSWKDETINNIVDHLIIKYKNKEVEIYLNGSPRVKIPIDLDNITKMFVGGRANATEPVNINHIYCFNEYMDYITSKRLNEYTK